MLRAARDAARAQGLRARDVARDAWDAARTFG
jgi:hypothetical protein